jgi:hypothetical protein
MAIETETTELETSRARSARPGDWLQYRYGFTRWGVRDRAVATRQVIATVTDGIGAVLFYTVEGGFRVEPKDVLTIIPMHTAPEVPGPLDPGQ